MLLELGLADLVGGALQHADGDVADVVTIYEDARGIPIGNLIEGLDVGFARAVRGPIAAPLVFVPRPTQHSGQSCIRGDARIVGITAQGGFRFGDYSQRRGLEIADGGRVFGILAIEVGGTVEAVAGGWVEVFGLVQEGENGIEESRDEDESQRDAPGHIPGPAQVPQQDSGPKGGGQRPQLPGLIVELEDGVDAVAKSILDEDEVGGEDEEGGEGY